VDVIFIYDTDDGGSELPLHDHWSRVVRRTVATLDTPTADGMVWRVDLRLRPEGSQGAIVNSVAAAERYYETWGRLWERAAMLRARPSAGSQELGAQLEREVILPFVYRHGVDPTIATALAELVQRSRAELSSAPDRDLKLGPGGIREAEFFIQSLQLIWGGREPSLRVTGSLAALERLQSRGLVTDREARSIAEAYLLLRRVEHRVQWMSGIQTHLVPADPDELGRLARSLGFEHAAGLEAGLARAREAVHELFAALAPAAPRPLPRYHALIAQIEREDAELAGTSERLFGSPEVGEHLAALTRRPDGLLGELTRERYPDLADQLVDALVESPDPEQAARYLRSFFQRFVSPASYIAALAGDPRALHRLATVLGASAFVGEAVVGRPDLVDIILFGGGLPGDAHAAVSTELETWNRSGAEEFDRRDAFVGALRRAKRRVMVEVAVADLAGTIETRDATRILSELADDIVERSVEYELAGDVAGLSVIAVGKLGGREIGYGSDLDVLFIYDPAAAPADRDPAEHFVRHAQRIIRLVSEPHPSGPGYELDTRLRPSGAQGLLVTSLASFARYHGVPLEGDSAGAAPSVLSSGAAWERQALLRARAAAGDRALGARVIEVAHVAAYERGAPPAEEIHRLRLRMERELARERPGRYDLKTGHGGLLDIEFSTQWLQMRYGADRRVRTTDTLEALEALGTLGYLLRQHYETLRDGYTFLRRLEQRIHVLHSTGAPVIDERAPGLSQLARRMGLTSTARESARQALITRYRDVTHAIRAAYLGVLGVES
jgi:glutamate-ammonia-ligase adenylyltransferase